MSWSVKDTRSLDDEQRISLKGIAFDEHKEYQISVGLDGAIIMHPTKERNGTKP